MHVVVAPDSFGTTLTAAVAAAAFAAGWREVAPHDELDLVPLSDGGPGLLAALEAALPDALRVAVECSGPTGRPISAAVLRAGPTAYVESALACGLAALEAARGDVRRATTYGVGELLTAAAALAGVATVVVGLGGSGTNDGGAGMWAALGAEPADVLRAGGAGLADLRRLLPPPAPAIRLVAATDVDNPLLGATGASRVFGPQKGADEDAVRELERGLAHWADLVAALPGPGGAERPGAGAAGGLGFGLFALGAERVPGIELVMRETRLAARVERRRPGHHRRGLFRRHLVARQGPGRGGPGRRGRRGAVCGGRSVRPKWPPGGGSTRHRGGLVGGRNARLGRRRRWRPERTASARSDAMLRGHGRGEHAAVSRVAPDLWNHGAREESAATRPLHQRTRTISHYSDR